MKKKITIVVPSYNEASNIEKLLEALNKTTSALPYDFNILFVDDGSKDETMEKLLAIVERQRNVFYLKLSRNFGHQNALKAGIDLVKSDADAILSMDGDLQHPPELIPELVTKWEEGYDVVYTVREDDPSLSYFKNKSSVAFYRVMNMLSDIKFEPGTADFRLIDHKVAVAFSNLRENEPFIRGLINWMGFRQCAVRYKPHPRFSGKSKYTLSRMVQFAIQGITSFSIRPLSLAIYLGIALSTLAAALFFAHVFYSLYFGHVISGWASIMCTIVFFGGLNLIVLGIIGIYVGKLFMQAKGRPNYFVSSTNYRQ